MVSDVNVYCASCMTCPHETLGLHWNGLYRSTPDVRMVHLVPSRINYTVKDIAELVFAEVYKHHGLMNELLGIKQRMSSAYHPESDGSTERANRTIGQVVRAIVSPTQTDWVMKLPFMLNMGRVPKGYGLEQPIQRRVPKRLSIHAEDEERHIESS